MMALSLRDSLAFLCFNSVKLPTQFVESVDCSENGIYVSNSRGGGFVVIVFFGG